MSHTPTCAKSNQPTKEITCPKWTASKWKDQILHIFSHSLHACKWLFSLHFFFFSEMQRYSGIKAHWSDTFSIQKKKRWIQRTLCNHRLTYDTDVKSCDDVRLSGEFWGEGVTMEEIMGDVWGVRPRLVLHHCLEWGMSCEMEEKAETMKLLPQIENLSHTHTRKH